MGRRQSREGALQMLYSWDIGNEDYQTSYFTIKEVLELSDKDHTFMMSLVERVINNVEKYDADISKCLIKWNINRLSVIDRSILRMALAELDGSEPTPKQIVVNEAIELAKEYSDSDSYRYINGILGNVELYQVGSKDDSGN